MDLLQQAKNLKNVSDSEEEDALRDLQASTLAPPPAPTAVESAADPASLAMINAKYGPHARLVTNMLLTFDAYFRLYHVLRYHFLGPPTLMRQTSYDHRQTISNRMLTSMRADGYQAGAVRWPAYSSRLLS